MEYIVKYDIAAFFLILTIGIHFFYTKNIRSQKLTVISMMIITTFMACVMDLVTIYVDENAVPLPIPVLYLINNLYLMCVVGISALYYSYTFVCSRGERRITMRDGFTMGGPYIFFLGMLIVNLFTGAIFYFDENNRYTHGEAYILVYIIAAVTMVEALARTVIARKNMSNWQIFTIFFYSIIIFGVMVLQNYRPNVMMMQFAEAIACEIVCLTVENPVNMMDDLIGCYNKKAFVEQFNYRSLRLKRFQVVVFRIEGLRYITELMGITESNHITKIVGTELMNLVSRRCVYYIGNQTFAIMDSKTDEEWKKITDSIKQRFRSSFELNGVSFYLQAPTCILRCPDVVNNITDALDIINFALKDVDYLHDDVIIEGNEMILKQGRREGQVLDAIRKGLRKDLFQVYYQPIYDDREKRVTRAEALVRLIDENLGFISPDEFIGIAEKKGLIIELGALVFKKVCQFISEEQLWQKGIERVDVNLSAVQCMQEDLAERLIDMMDAFHVPYKAINLEVTETAAIASKETLRHNMEKLMEKGVNFSVDDFGTGYSSTTTIIENPFTVVKIDKDMLWQAMENSQAMLALKHSIAMINDMGLEVITEGIENKEMAEMLVSLGCTLHQGFYYSKPVPKEKFLEFINVANGLFLT